MNARLAWLFCGMGAVAAGLYSCRDLLAVWRNSPYDRWGGWAALIWLSGISIALVRNGWKPRPLWCCAGMAAMALGLMTEVSTAVQAGLVMIVVGWPGVSFFRRGIMAVGALAWMPVLGWVTSGWLPSSGLNMLRIVWALGAWAAWERLK